MIAMITRLSGQKGLDLVECVLPEIMNTGAQLVILGMGESRYVDLFSWAQWKYPQQVSANFQMNNALSHKLYAAADIGLNPGLIFRLQGYCDALFPAGEGGFCAGRGRARSHLNEPVAKGGAGAGLKAVKEATYRGDAAGVCNNADMPREAIGIK